ncbi:molybdenum cofactor guanylyltransferase [Gorillibacterium timonense]|uniref:molybdenum cofactor guanylyltransferase n=1 Tax=Gorillibacterium timonense TaxID=1689269 RepID=UPI00071D1547|nr:molybdenum cofactor guanylyltransferase [Gorillibacterium timonense]
MLTGVILAGDSNRKTGAHSKALLPFCGEILIQRQVRMLKSACREIIVVTNEPKLYLPILGNSVRIITDYFPGKGQLGGMHAALSLSTSNRLWVVGSDMPFLSAKAAGLMQSQMEPDTDAVIPRYGSESHMLHGIYHKRCLIHVSAALDKGHYELADLEDNLRVKTVDELFFKGHDIEPHFVTRINTTEAYHQAMHLNYLHHDHEEAARCV